MRCRSAILTLMMLSVLVPAADAADEPQGLLLRKGLVTWQMNLGDARRFIEQDIHPKTLVLLRNQKPEGFGCEKTNTPGVTQCTWACCVDLGEKDLAHFATLWFFQDRFYAYDVTFDTPLFPRLSSALADKFGAPSKEMQDTRVSPMIAMGQFNSYVVNSRRWDIGNSVVLLSDRGGQGKMLAGEIYVANRPLLQQATPAINEAQLPPVKLPF